ncbi:MAG: hypothetical protein A2998_03235 [Candidatus Staskawiczbacteria bacterium RIFCSPLOWO2_01_FULL_37_25b]|uniref:Thoeris protein ThsB TIR-like domain-containing protein n=1 Tax=Candidatus Staskawiczbacteria bacterium RIFCSPLOWO2_01_FULL_37_25b TaxID=1802213 RepID=A0A1G2IAU6_9BACT|nr:MAG: hypothetical protein A2998_03235 [Candidatus Staskawiczbacteria bacterium RIFCSPLOWO2_01_FULL_37_25b]
MKKVFTSFAIEDEKFRDFFVGQSKNDNSPFEFVDMSVKKAWETNWEEKCREKIKGCHGMVALVSKNTYNASGELFEVRCAYEEKIPVMLMYVNDDRPVLPPLLSGRLVNTWSWVNLKSFINRL